MTSIADELFFEGWLDSLSPMDRASVDRVLESRGYNSRLSQHHIDNARDEGYRRGLKEGRAEKPAAA